MFTNPVQFLPRAAAAVSSLVLLAAAALPAQAAPGTKGPGSPSGDQPPSGAHSLRAPVTDENFYFVMADRFSNGNTANDLSLIHI